jgi:glycosyltransferase involved in cell wall biosynthesis
MSSPEISKTSSTFYTQIERTLGRFATSRFIAVSEDEREFFLRLKLASEQRVAVVENAIDDRDFEYLSEEAAHEDMREKPLTFGSTMRFSAQKAPHHLIEAFLRTTHDLPKVPMRLVIAGDGELYGEAKKQVEGSGAGEKISIPGWSDDVKELLQNLDVFVVSSAYESGLSYSTMEAMAAELPIVSTNVFGTRNTISKLPGNILVPVGDPAALAKGMKQMAALATPETLRHELREIGRTNRAYVQEHFRQTEITRRTIEIYRSLQRQ